MLLCNHHHMKSLEESTYTPSLTSPCSNDRKSSTLSANTRTEKNYMKPSHQLWMQLVQRLHDRTSSVNPVLEDDSQLKSQKRLQRRKSWAIQETISSWNSEKCDSNKQVLKLINHYSNMLTTDNHERSLASFNDRPKSILRPKGTANKYRFSKEVTFATN